MSKYDIFSDENEHKEAKKTKRKRKAPKENLDFKKIALLIVMIPVGVLVVGSLFLVSLVIFLLGLISVLAGVFGMALSLEYVKDVSNFFYLFFGSGTIILGILVAILSNFVRENLVDKVRAMTEGADV